MKTGSARKKVAKRKKPKHVTSHELFDGTLQKTQIWINDLIWELDWDNKPHKAYLALRTVLHALRDRLPVEEAVQLGAQLPMLVRGFYYEGWSPKGKPHKERKKEEFLAHVKDAFTEDVTVNAQSVVRAVFRLLVKHTSPGEIEQVKHVLPKTMQELWP